jgi:hypothetical protein
LPGHKSATRLQSEGSVAIKIPGTRTDAREKEKTSPYLFVLVPFVEVLELEPLLLAGGDDMSSCLEHPMNSAETAATKNISFFISVYPFCLERIVRRDDVECKP